MIKDTYGISKELKKTAEVSTTLNLFKLVGVETRSIKAVHTALTAYFNFSTKEIGGLAYLESAKTWVFFAYPEEVKKKTPLFDNKYGIKISSFSQEEIDTIMAQLIIYANNTSTNKMELNIVRKTCKKLINAFIQKDTKSIENVISLTSQGLIK